MPLVLVIFCALLLSIVLGLPFANLFLTTQNKKQTHFKAIYLSALFGYSLLHFTYFVWTQALHVGVTTATPYALGSLVPFLAWGLYSISRDRKIWWDFTQSYAGTLFVLFCACFISVISIAYPILAGWWNMAYGVGDDGSRVFMFSRYFLDHPHQYGELARDTLYWSMNERPMFEISGPILRVLFNLNQSLAYSIANIMGGVMTFLAALFLLESMISRLDTRFRVLLFIALAILLGTSGQSINLFYSGRTTHYFSVYPFLAALSVLFIPTSRIRYAFGWLSFWFIAISGFYTLRYTVYLTALIGLSSCYFLFIRNGYKKFLKINIGLVIALLVSFGLYLEEFRAILRNASVTLDRQPWYGFPGEVLERTLKLFGLLATHQSLYVSQIHAVLLLGGFIVANLVAFLFLFRSIRLRIFLLLFLSILISLAGSFAIKDYFTFSKIIAYGNVFLVLAVATAFMYLIAKHSHVKKMIAVLLLGATISIQTFFALSIFEFYRSLIFARGTYIDSAKSSVISSLHGEVGCSSPCRDKTIFGFDYSAERHLLLREAFSAFHWQPVRGSYPGQALWFDKDIINVPKKDYDLYEYDYILVAPDNQCDSIDFSGNKNLLYQSKELIFYGRNSSLIEFQAPAFYTYIVTEPTGCRKNGFVIEQATEAVFVNQGKHRKIHMTILLPQAISSKVPPPGKDMEKLLCLAGNHSVCAKIVSIDSAMFSENASWLARLELPVDPEVRLTRLKINLVSLHDPIKIYNVRWSY